MTPALISRLYFTTWLTLGVIAIGYFTYLFQNTGNQQIAQSTAPPAMKPARLDKSGAASMVSAKNSADPGISMAIASMQMEMKRLKGSLETMGKENAALKQHVKNLEAAFGPATGSLPKETDKPHPGMMKAKKQKVSAPKPKVALSTGPMPGNGFAETDIPQSPLPIAGVRAPTRTKFAIQLAKKVAPEAMGARWMALKKQHPGILGRLKPRIIEVPSKGPRKTTVTLIAGPYDNAASAALACARLIALGTKCESTVFTGKPIGKVATR